MHPTTSSSKGIYLSLVCCFCLAPTASAQSPTVDLTDLSIEDLLQVEVTSASRRERKLAQTAAAVHVITQEDIQRSGATSVADSLRMAPGVYVAQFDSNKWVVGVRGFNRRFSDKLLVMVDGRSVYSPLFSGVYWENLDMPLDNIERIEVIRGPGGSIWGSNAVNGVINVITKSAAETQGSMVSSGVGNREGNFSSLRYGGKAGENIHYRVDSKFFKRPGQLDPSGEPGPDEWGVTRGGFRMDWDGGGDDSLTVSGDIYEGDAPGPLSIPILTAPYRADVLNDQQTSGSDVLARWKRRYSDNSIGTLQVYHDRSSRGAFLLNLNLVESTDFDYQHVLTVSDDHQLMFGGGYRLNRDRVTSSEILRFDPAQRSTLLYHVFGQEDWSFAGDKLMASLGGKLEHNSYTGWEVQPSASLLWNRDADESLWASVSRAVVLPSRTTSDFRYLDQVFPGADGRLTRVEFFGVPTTKAESLVAYQAGYRRRITRETSIDVAYFFHDYARLRLAAVGAPYIDSMLAGNPVIIPVLQDNSGRVNSAGLEIAGVWQPHQNTTLHLSYSTLRLDPIRNGGAFSDDDDAPNHMLHAAWRQDLPGGWKWDTSYYYVGAVTPSLSVPAYHRLDSRVAARLSSNVEVSLAWQNLLDNQHPESGRQFSEQPQEIGRSAYAKITYQF